MKVYVKATKVFIGEPRSVNIFLLPEEAKKLEKRISKVIKEKESTIQIQLVLFPKKKTIQVYPYPRSKR